MHYLLQNFNANMHLHKFAYWYTVQYFLRFLFVKSEAKIFNCGGEKLGALGAGRFFTPKLNNAETRH